MPSERRPNLFIVGAQKSGTSTLASWLGGHPQVLMSYPKEPGFLAFGEEGYTCLDGYGKPSPASQWVVNSKEKYLALFREASDEHRIIGEASTWYLAIPGVAESIRQFSPDAKIVVILRNPVERAYSAWSHARRDDHEPLADFGEALAAEKDRDDIEYLMRYRAMGHYSEQLAAYLKVFPAEQLLILFYDDLRDNPDQLQKKLYAFLGISLQDKVSLNRRYNRSGMPRFRFLQEIMKSHRFRTFWRAILPGRSAAWIKCQLDRINLQTLPPMEDTVREQLTRYYRPEIEKLMSITGRDLSNWLR